MKRTWRMRLGQVRVRMLHGQDEQGVWTSAQYAVQLTATLMGVPRHPGRQLATTMTAAQARSLARALTDMADATDKQNNHTGYVVEQGPEADG